MSRSNPARRELWYPLANDPGLHSAGVEVGARVTDQPKGPPHLSIIFRAGGKEASVDCVHVAVYAGSLESLPPDADLARSSGQQPVILAPEEHFFALNSYVAGIAEVGLEGMFAMAREAENFPVGFNALMQQQVLAALSNVAPAAALDFCLWVVDDATQDRKDTYNGSDFLALVKKSLAMNPHAPPELLARLARDEEWYVRERVARNESTPLEILACLAGDPIIVVREGIAGNKNTPPELLARLAGDEDWVRWEMALNPSAPPKLLARLAWDNDKKVRGNVAVNENTPPEVLARLAGDEDKDVRGGVARNESTPLEILAHLAGDTNTWVRWGAARNENTPPVVLARLAGDEDKYVRRRANLTLFASRKKS